MHVFIYVYVKAIKLLMSVVVCIMDFWGQPS